MPYNKKSLLNLGKRRTKAKRKQFLFTQKAIDWIEQHKNQTEAIEALILRAIEEEKKQTD